MELLGTYMYARYACIFIPTYLTVSHFLAEHIVWDYLMYFAVSVKCIYPNILYACVCVCACMAWCVRVGVRSCACMRGVVLVGVGVLCGCVCVGCGWVCVGVGSLLGWHIRY